MAETQWRGPFEVVLDMAGHVSRLELENAALKECLKEMAEILNALPDDCKEWCPRFEKCVTLDAQTGDMQCPLNMARGLLK